MVYEGEKFPRWCLLEVVNGATNAVEDAVNLGSLREKLGSEILGK